jgi:hypothetical protein
MKYAVQSNQRQEVTQVVSVIPTFCCSPVLLGEVKPNKHNVIIAITANTGATVVGKVTTATTLVGAKAPVAGDPNITIVNAGATVAGIPNTSVQGALVEGNDRVATVVCNEAGSRGVIPIVNSKQRSSVSVDGR